MSAENIQAKNWVFVINNFTQDDVDNVMALENNCDAIIAEYEHLNEGTPHIQGYVSFSKRMYRSQVSRLLPRAFLEKANGGWTHNWAYCSKEGNVFIEKGHVLKQKTSDTAFEEMFKDMKRLTPQEFEDAYPKFWVMHREKVMAVMIENAGARVSTWDGKLTEKNVWIWGKAGVGKSKWAASQGTYNEILKKNLNKWWDGYNLLSHKIIILEDYPCLPQGNMLVQHMKIWGDRYPFEGECKGSHLLVEPGRFFFIVTSNYPISECFAMEQDIEAIQRRFQEIEMTEENHLLLSQSILDRSILKE